MHGLLKLIRVIVRYDVAVSIKQVAPQVALLHCTEVPAMAVIVGKLCVIQLRIQIRNFFQKPNISPLATNDGTLRIAIEHAPLLFNAQFLPLFGPHKRRIGLVIPHRVTEIRNSQTYWVGACDRLCTGSSVSLA